MNKFRHGEHFVISVFIAFFAAAFFTQPALATPPATPTPSGTPAAPVTLTGHIDSPTSGVAVYVYANSVNITSELPKIEQIAGNAVKSVLTDADGNYSITAPSAPSYTFIPKFTGITFSPSLAFVDLGHLVPTFTGTQDDLHDTGCTSVDQALKIVTSDGDSKALNALAVSLADKLTHAAKGKHKAKLLSEAADMKTRVTVLFNLLIGQSRALPEILLSACPVELGCTSQSYSATKSLYKEYINALGRNAFLMTHLLHLDVAGQSGYALLQEARIKRLKAAATHALKKIPAAGEVCVTPG